MLQCMCCLRSAMQNYVMSVIRLQRIAIIVTTNILNLINRGFPYMIFVLHLQMFECDSMSLLDFLSLSPSFSFLIYLSFSVSHHRESYIMCSFSIAYCKKCDQSTRKSYWMENKFVCCPNQKKKSLLLRKYLHLFVHFISFEFLALCAFLFAFAFKCISFSESQMQPYRFAWFSIQFRDCAYKCASCIRSD